jgi:hypothetical protein
VKQAYLVYIGENTIGIFDGENKPHKFHSDNKKDIVFYDENKIGILWPYQNGYIL